MSFPNNKGEGSVLAAEVTQVGLLDAMTHALRQGINMSQKELIAVWSLSEALPHQMTYVVFPGFDCQEFDENDLPAVGGRGWLQVLARYADDFARKGGPPVQMFSRILDALSCETIRCPIRKRGAVFYLQHARGLPYLLAIATGIDAYTVTALPPCIKTVKELRPKELEMCETKRLPCAIAFTREDIESSKTSALVISQNHSCVLMYKDDLEESTLEYVDTFVFLGGAIASKIDNWAGCGWDMALSDVRYDHETQRHELAGLRIAMEVQESWSDAVYYESSDSFYYRVNEETAGLFLQKLYAELFSMHKAKALLEDHSEEMSTSRRITNQAALKELAV